MKLPRTGAWIDTLRLASGLTLFTFALTHFLNHALGLWSLDAMATAQAWRLALTRSQAGSALLALALIVHVSLALWRIARLRTWRLPRAAIWQLSTGALVSIVIWPHLFQSGVGPRAAGVAMTYPGALSLIWPASIVMQTLAARAGMDARVYRPQPMAEGRSLVAALFARARRARRARSRRRAGGRLRRRPANRSSSRRRKRSRFLIPPPKFRC